MKAVRSLLKSFMKASLRQVLNFVKTYPKLRIFVVKVVSALGLKNIAHSTLMRLRMSSYSQSTAFDPNSINHLSPYARQIYLDLKQAVKCIQQENH